MVKNLVSVIVPTNNRATMLKRAIASIQNQTYKKIEIIIIANGCKDNTVNVVEELQKKYNNIKFLNFENSLGGAKARNIGLDNAKGEYIAFLDDDDEWISTKLEKQLEIMRKNNYCIVGCNYNEILNNKIKKRKLKEEIDFENMCFENELGSYSFCITKKEYIKNIRINNFLKANQDWDLWLKILKNTQKKAYVIQDYLVNYYQHNNKISTNYKNRLEAQKIFLSYWENEFNNNAIEYNKMKILFYQYMIDKNIKNYINNLPYIFLTIMKSPYKFKFKKYYVYLNCFRYLKKYKKH